MNPYLSIADLTIQRDRVTVVTVDGLEIEQGKVVAVIGPNGAGKSSLLLGIANIIPRKTGSVTLGGLTFGKLHAVEFRRRVALVMQEPMLLDATVRQNIGLGLYYRGTFGELERLKVDHWAEKMKISHLLDRPADKISGGEAQRVSLARAFALEPDLLLLDEPFSALDPHTRKGLTKDLRSALKETNTTTLFVTHNLREARDMADQIAVIWDGKLIQCGSWDEITSNPATESLRQYLGGHLHEE